MYRVRTVLRAHKTFFLSIGFLVIFSFAVSKAAPMYSPGQTLDPSCAPGTTDCTVSTGPWATVTGGINYAGGKVGIGTTTPTALLSIQSAPSTAPQLVFTNNSGTEVMRIAADSNSNLFMGSKTGAVSTGTFNTGFGYEVLATNSTGTQNVGMGYHALYLNTTGTYNTAVGTSALRANTTGVYNTAMGYKALFSSTTGGANVAVGYSSMVNSAAGNSNTALGQETLVAVTGSANTAVGAETLFGLHGGSSNIGIGAYVDVPNADADGQLNIGDVLYGTGMYHGSTTITSAPTADGKIGIGVAVPQHLLDLNHSYFNTDGSASLASGGLTVDSSGNVNITGTLTCNGGSCGGRPSQWDTVTGGINYAGGRVGIGTTTPAAALDIEGDGAIIAAGTDSSGIGVPNLGAGARLMWIPSVGAFRVGIVDGTQWDSANVGQYSIALGNNTFASDFGTLAIGMNASASNVQATAIGPGAEASGNGAIAIGASTYADASGTTAIGLSSGADKNYATAIGYGATAHGVQSLTIGTNSYTGADNSTAIGYNNTVIDSLSGGKYAFAGGANTLIYADYGTTFGRGTNVTSYNGMAVGRYNIGGGTATSWVATEPLFEVGNGNASNDTSDALIVLKNGKTGIGLSPSLNGGMPQYMLQAGSANITGIVARFQNSTGTCDINPTTTALVCSSDMNLKKNITLIADNSAWNFNTNITAANQSALARILALVPVSYNWNTEADGTTKHPGFIAQDVQHIFPDLVATDPSTGLLSMNYTGLIPYTVQAIREMNLNVTAIDDLSKTNTWRGALLAWFGDAGNGIQNFFSKTITTNQLCVKDDSGTTCLTRSQVNQLMQNQSGTTTVVSGGSSGGTGSGDSGNNNAGTDNGNTQTPATPQIDVTDPTHGQQGSGDAGTGADTDDSGTTDGQSN